MTAADLAEIIRAIVDEAPPLPDSVVEILRDARPASEDADAAA